MSSPSSQPGPATQLGASLQPRQAPQLSAAPAGVQAAWDQVVAPEPLVAALEELVVAVREAGNLVVLKTLRGAAPMVATAIDGAMIAPLVATVAGNDTVLAITRSEVAGGIIARYFRSLAGVGGPRARPAGADQQARQHHRVLSPARSRDEYGGTNDTGDGHRSRRT